MLKNKIHTPYQSHLLYKAQVLLNIHLTERCFV